MRRGGPSGLVLRAHRDHGLAVRIQRDRDHDRPAADLAVLDVLLVTGGAVDEQFDRLAAVRASGVDGGQHPGPPDGRFTHGASVHSSHRADTRSDEHTSELQSLMRISYAVFCLKKKNTENIEK